MAKKSYRRSTTPTIVVDAGKLDADIRYFCDRNQISIKNFYASIGMGTATINNIVRNAKTNTICADFGEYEFCEKFGIISDMCLKLICLKMGKCEEEYIAKKKKQTALKAVTASELLAEDSTTENILNDMVQGFSNVVSTMRDIRTLIENLCRIQTQNTEYLKDINDGIEKLNDKWK